MKKIIYQEKNNLVNNLFKNCFYGILIIIGTFFFLNSILKRNTYNEYLLITKGVVTDGVIINKEKRVEEGESNDRTVITTVYRYDYSFEPTPGKNITGEMESSKNLFNFVRNPIPVKIEYVKESPEINRIKNYNTECKNLTEFILKKVCLFIVIFIAISYVGVKLIYTSIKKYLTERKTYAN